ncbi:MAG TPA: 1-acyl-sn-glycerol-3-phosphate acyltransferase [Anaeromyxobacteraceae bacterium]|nr:1-acyl-sn-glycerol-3-phosphate acyltransferase [Anaeromyxobacteraceae bacterium]
MSSRNAGRKPRRAARAVKPALGNDPFERGAAQRPAAPALEPEPAAPVAAAPPAHAAAAPAEAETGAVAPAATASPAAVIDEDAIRRLESRVARLASDGERRLEEIGVRLRDTALQPQARIRNDLGLLAARVVPAVRGRLAALGRLRHALEGGGPVDGWGQDPELIRATTPALDFLVNAWWRVDARGLDQLPEGPVIVIANHGGAVHWDALVLAHVFRKAGRELRPLLDATALATPVLGRSAVRLGAVAASADAADQLLAERRSIAVFPQGSRASEQPWQERYRLHQFGRGGFARIALRSGVPVVPCAIVGSEEAAAPFARRGWLADALSMPLLAGTRGLPIGPLDALPLPSRWTMRFGDPFQTSGRVADAESAVAVNALAADVRSTLQRMLDEDVAARRSVYL